MDFLSVSELTKHIQQLFNMDSALKNVTVCGEISNFKYHSSGHLYFSLKDETSAIKCVMFKSSATSLRFRPENGMKVIAKGYVSVYERDGAYQLYCANMSPDGVGDLHVAFEQLKAKLQSEGLFDKPKKRLPAFPKKIAIITSPTGAAVRDMLRIIGNRWPLTEIVIVPVRVQGDAAASEIADAIKVVNEKQMADLIITGRGGGSIEDLWAFNEEIVARAIYKSDIPVISAVGHEPDITISDYVADRRAATPSNAAEIAVPDINEVKDILNSYLEKFNPNKYIANKRLDFDRYRDKLQYLINKKLDQKKHQVAVCATSLDALSPLKVMSRGYSVASLGDKTITSVNDVNKGDSISLRVLDGSINCIVD